jgi:hypothetical protein
MVFAQAKCGYSKLPRLWILAKDDERNRYKKPVFGLGNVIARGSF